ncbi:integrase catalytic domain-containing protein [Trichonephila clavipes]|uniref:Integrase catalytic domain-containing protein n=1 Tax=Trichonephila clavipes TaxID=2585209 RepID=A0A8X6W3I0_TRICX|nr:integrase catalytic domain-containing protein [Trichonephila clavipes]
MKQKQTKNKHSGSARARSDQWTMDIQKRLKSTLEGKINRIETFIERANEETDSVEIKVYRFNRVNFGVSSSPFLLAVTIRHHIEKYKHEFPDTVELLDRNFYVDDLISGGNEFEEALQTSRRAKNIMEAAEMDLRKWITNDANLMEQWKKENFNVHPVQETVSLGANGTKVLGLSWNTNEDYLTTDTKSLLEFVSLDKNTKRFILQAVGKIFDP